MIELFRVHVPANVDAPLLETLHSGYVGQGAKVAEFECQLADWFGTPRVLAVNNCTAAIQLALRLAEVGPGDEVISTPMTCTATNMPILAAGAEIIWADINPRTGNIDPDDAWTMSKESHKVKAIVCVDWGGTPCDLDDLLEIAEDAGVPLIEDAAHAFGASYKGQPIGSVADLTCFSFQAIKHITTVDGGALTCRHGDDYARGKLLRWYGIDRDQPRRDFRCEADIAEWGYKFHMNDVAATIGLAQLPHAADILAKHRSNAAYYTAEIKNRGLRHIAPLDMRDDRISSHWLYSILTDDRDGLIAYLRERGIQASRVHERNDIHTCFRRYRWRVLPGIDEFVRRQLAIPVGWWVGDEERRRVMDALEEFDRKEGAQ